ncbi:hypothetical protein AC477_00075 [miscellaneous Crenarchaeota group-1 archaeon SG8-32-1]|uniref:Uncharacterized protein n=1 Tax=miscellaneous Crenarchaeota group-1 archaeon SG8-32-1 TaxID=1685124 RepID=A0A0M0C1H8_9ARCH|nr:MAG: hypothetical protein AC477_00075 [miscellaneous Crenarchaeota group-1 archaeon SG8-32-1]
MKRDYTVIVDCPNNLEKSIAPLAKRGWTVHTVIGESGDHEKLILVIMENNFDAHEKLRKWTLRIWGFVLAILLFWLFIEYYGLKYFR